MQKPLSQSSQALSRGCVLGDEPPLSPCASGPRKSKVYYVAETRLIGNERRYLNQCIDSNWVSSKGAFVSRFENAFATQAGCNFAIACASGTAALHLALAALGIGPGDEVVIPTFTMIATANAVRYTGATLKLVDSEPEHFNIDPNLVEAAITSRTKAIIVVHIYGQPAQMGRLREIAGIHRLHLIEDAAEAHGAEVLGRRVGSLGIAGTFSFYANKIVTTGEGGMVTSNDRQFAERVRLLCNHAFHPRQHFRHEHLGFNYRMTNLQAAVGLAQTERLDEIVAARRKVRTWYQQRLCDQEGLQLPSEARSTRSVFWMYAVRTTAQLGCTSHELRIELARRGIETRSFFLPMHLQPIYADQFSSQHFEVAESLFRSGFYLPTHENLGEDDVDWIAQQIKDISSRVATNHDA
jgi:perosamine synthetase